MRKKHLTLFCTVLLSFSGLCGCSSAEPAADTSQATETNQIEQPTTIGEITAIDDTTVTISLRGSKQPAGERPEISAGEMPEMPEGERPNGGKGEKPDIPEGEMPEPPEGERPNGGKPDFTEKTITVDLSAFDTIDANSAEIGDLLELELSEDDTVLSVKKADLSQMPDISDKGDSNVA